MLARDWCGVQAATDNFHPSKKVGEGGFGTVYGGMLHHTRVAIKVLKNRDGIRAQSEFEQEVNRSPLSLSLSLSSGESWNLLFTPSTRLRVSRNARITLQKQSLV